MFEYLKGGIEGLNAQQFGADPLILSANIDLLLVINDLIESLQLLRFRPEFVVFVVLISIDVDQLPIEDVILPIDHQ